MALPPGPAALPHMLLLLPALLSSGTPLFTPWRSPSGGKPLSPLTLGLDTYFRPQSTRAGFPSPTHPRPSQFLVSEPGCPGSWSVAPP